MSFPNASPCPREDLSVPTVFDHTPSPAGGSKMLWANYQIIRYEQGAGSREQGEGKGEIIDFWWLGRIGGFHPQLITPQYLQTPG